ncbi:hypothetical protein AgCh_008036 [Apium graveolens]
MHLIGLISQPLFESQFNYTDNLCYGQSKGEGPSTAEWDAEKKQYLPVILLWVEAGELPHQDGVAALDENSENGASDEDLVTSDAGGSIPQAQLDEMDSDHDLVDNVDKQLMRCKLSIELEIKTSCHQSRLVLTEE